MEADGGTVRGDGEPEVEISALLRIQVHHSITVGQFCQFIQAYQLIRRVGIHL